VQHADLEFTYIIHLHGKCRILNVCAEFTMAVFCGSLISCFPGMLLRYVLNDSEMVPVAPIIIIIITIIIIIPFMQGISIYISEINYVPREYSVAAILLLMFMVLMSLVSVLNLLYFYISTFRSMCAVPSMALFLSSLT